MSLILGLAGTELNAGERTWLKHKHVCGVILFARNIASRTQLESLIADLRRVRKDLIICVDQEGGRVARCREGFITLPPLEQIGLLAERKKLSAAFRACELHAQLMSTDMIATGFDISFAPVVDLKRGNLAIGNRAFSADAALCAKLSVHYVQAMQAAGMAATIKHFPGHGTVKEDTHYDLAIDNRSKDVIFKEDLLPFKATVGAGAKAVMTAHVSYPAVDTEAAGYSKIWLQDILRKQLGFKGVIFSDDISMLGGANVGTLAERIERHYAAGCDVILVCQVDATAEVMQKNLGRIANAELLASLRSKRHAVAKRKLTSKKFAAMQARLETLLSSVG
jgi:beta-N-acetylhexosaminidase